MKIAKKLCAVVVLSLGFCFVRAVELKDLPHESRILVKSYLNPKLLKATEYFSAHQKEEALKQLGRQRISLNGDELKKLVPLAAYFRDISLQTKNYYPEQLRKYVNLVCLDVKLPMYADLRFLSSLRKLERFSITAPSIKSLMPIVSCKNLRDLSLDIYTDFPYIGLLSKMPHLKNLTLNYKGQSSMLHGLGLDKLVQLKGLDLRSDSIKDLLPLAKLKKLSILSVTSSSVSDISSISELSNLWSLVLNTPNALDFSPLLNLKKLERLGYPAKLCNQINLLAEQLEKRQKITFMVTGGEIGISE